LRAFRRAFDQEDDVLLVLHHINRQADPQNAERLRQASSGINVRLIGDHLTEREYLSLLAACDCYVSLHRSEGLGLTMAEAMYLGKPVIATAYSGNLDFMNVNNSLLVRYDLVELDRDYGPYEKGNLWAEPESQHAGELMRWVYEEKEKAGELGERARKDIMKLMDPDKVSREIRCRLERIYSDFL